MFLGDDIARASNYNISLLNNHLYYCFSIGVKSYL